MKRKENERKATSGICNKYEVQNQNGGTGKMCVLNSGKVQILQNCTYNNKVQLLKYSSFLVFTVAFLGFKKGNVSSPKYGVLHHIVAVALKWLSGFD